MSDAAESRDDRLHDYPWQLSYSTFSHVAGGNPVNILHQFYIPVLKRSVRYDRVAGYFRSSSLAAASQGFSTFVGRQGRIRMIVGSDLNPDDVRAILGASEEKLSGALNKELEQTEQWPEDVLRGVELLAWMVAQGHLEIRVAFRVHAETGEPLAMDSVEDGYVHEKWALFWDDSDGRLYVSGSFNESKTALVHNAENIDVHRDWTSEENMARADEAEARFERTWNNENPSLRVMTLPEAVRKRLVAIAKRVERPKEIDNSSEAPVEIPPPSILERLRFALLRDGPKLPNGQYVGMVTAPVEPWPHQVIVARRLIDTWPYSYLLCDEVGLGKTIEAGLAIRSLYLSGLAKRVLISPPASLTKQWQREMASKFLLPFGRAMGGAQTRHQYILPFEEERPAESLYEPELTIVSTGLLARAERRSDIVSAKKFDIALVDEAHYARRKNSTQGTRVEARYGNLYRTIDKHLRKKSRSLLLATATPMQLDSVEVADLIRLTRRVGHFQFDPGLMNAYYHLLGKLVREEALEDDEWKFIHRAVTSTRYLDPLLWEFNQKSVVDTFSKFDVDYWLDSGMTPMSGLEGIRRLVFAASPLSRVMLRHTRPLLEIYRARGKLSANLAKREILPLVPIQFTTQEELAYEQLEEYCQGLAKQISKQKKGKKRFFALGMILSFLRLRFASSLFAIRESVRRRHNKVELTLRHLISEEEIEADEMALSDLLEEGEDDREAVGMLLKDRAQEDLRWERQKLSEMLQNLTDLSATSSKMTRLLEYLNKRRLAGGRIQQTVIFTRFYDTLTDIVDRLLRVDPNMLVGTYSGQGGSYLNPKTHRMTGVDREEIKHQFLRGEIDILVCTDAAAEGLNLQTADLLINFDLPWNPMKVEQRIGRIDRIGQKHDTIYVSNLCYLNSAEEIVYGRLLGRLAQAGQVVGTQQISLLPVTQDDFQDLADGTLSEDELTQRAVERAALARQRTASMEIPATELYDIYVRLSEQADQQVPPIQLDSIWHALSESSYLRELGCSVSSDENQNAIILRNIPGMPDGVALTTSRDAYERGIQDLEGSLHFATYGEPIFDQVVAHIAEFELPSCIRRLVVKDDKLGAEMVGYAVVCIGADGSSEMRLITCYEDLRGLQIAEDAQATLARCEQFEKSLSRIAKDAFDRRHAVPRIEEINEKSALSQVILDYLVAHGLLRSRQKFGQAADRFWQELTAIEQKYQDRDAIRITGIPVQTARQLVNPLFDLTLPNVGEEGYVDAGTTLLMSSLDASARAADSLHVAKADLSVDDVISRLEREINGLIKLL